MKVAYYILLLGTLGMIVRATVDLDQAGGAGSGERTSFFVDGSARETAWYVDGQRHGECKRWYPDGDLRAEGLFEQGRRTGTWRYFTPEGQIDLERSGEYVRDRRVGP